MGKAVLELQQLSCRYGDHEVLAGVNLRLDSGEIRGIGGASGSGKSTLLRILAGIERPESGQVLMGGRPVWQSGRRGRRPAVPRPGFVQQVFQDPVGALDQRWPIWRTITEPLTAPGQPTRLGRDARRSRALTALGTVGLATLPLDARPSELSVGQCQRIAILRSMMARPAVILADEPTSALDATNIQGVLDLLRAAAARGAAVVIVSHDSRVLRALCHQTMTLAGGQLHPGSASTR